MSLPAAAPCRLSLGHSRWFAVPVVAVLLGVAGCASQQAAALPKKVSQGAGQAALHQARLTARQQVAMAYHGYWRAYAAAMTSGSAARARALLAPYDPPAGVTQAISYLRPVWAKGEVAAGEAVPHILSISIRKHRAMLHDCLDLSHFGVLDQRTGRIVPGSFGLPRLNYFVTLVFSGGRWRVANMLQVEVPCEPS
jgi:hypothetical protein